MTMQLKSRDRNPTKDTSITLKYSGFFPKNLSDREKEKFFSALAVLLKSGMDVNQSIKLIKEQKLSKTISKITPLIEDRLINGDYFYEALSKSEHFSEYDLSNIKIGEETSYLAEFISQLEVYYSKKLKLKRLIINTFSYPVIVLLITGGTLYFMLSFIVPMFSTIFSRFNQELPKLTQMVMNFSNFLSNYSIYLLLTVVLLYFIHTILKRNITYRLNYGLFILKLPLVGDTILKIQFARFSLVMYYLIKSGTPLVNSLKLAHGIVSFYPLKVELEKTEANLIQGVSLYESISNIKMFPSSYSALIKVGEEVNQLENIFEKLSEQYSKELEHQTQIIGKVMEPLLILIVAIIVGTILIAMYLPLFNIGNVM